MQVGIPDVEEITNATLDHKLLVAGGNLRSFLQAATEGVPLGSQGEVVTKLFAALDKVEGGSGPVEPGNDAALSAFQKEIDVRFSPSFEPFMTCNMTQLACLGMDVTAAFAGHILAVF